MLKPKQEPFRIKLQAQHLVFSKIAQVNGYFNDLQVLYKLRNIFKFTEVAFATLVTCLLNPRLFPLFLSKCEYGDRMIMLLQTKRERLIMQTHVIGGKKRLSLRKEQKKFCVNTTAI